MYLKVRVAKNVKMTMRKINQIYLFPSIAVNDGMENTLPTKFSFITTSHTIVTFCRFIISSEERDINL